MSRKTRHLAMGLGVVLVWSACFVVISASRGDAPPGLYAGLRALLGGLPLLALAANRRIAFPPSQAWGWILLLAVTNTTIGLGGMFVSMALAGAALPAVLESSQALLVAPFAAFLFGERLTLGRFAGLLLGLMGVGLMAATWTVPLEEVADPTDTQYVPRPESGTSTSSSSSCGSSRGSGFRWRPSISRWGLSSSSCSCCFSTGRRGEAL